MSDPLARLKSLPPAPAPNDHPEEIKGNASLEHKRLNASILAYNIAHYPGSKVFGHEAFSNLKLEELNVRERTLGTEGPKILEVESILGITVEEGMLNVHGTLQGGCGAHLLDIATFVPVFALGLVKGRDASGYSQAINMIWHSPALPGTRLRVVGTSMTTDGRLSASRAEVYDKKTGRLLVSGVHSISSFKPPAAASKGKSKL